MRYLLIIPVLFASLLLAGCGEDEVSTPTACLEGPDKIATALVTAPEPVMLDGTTPISSCLVGDQPTGDLVTFGADAVIVATRLGRDAGGSGPEAIRAAIEAGYLVGAMQKGSENSAGIHSTLVDRVESAATNELEQTGDGARVHYDAGLEAGLKYG